MSAPRFFLLEPLPKNTTVGDSVALALTVDDVKHAVGALRLVAGEVVEVADPERTIWRIRLSTASRDAGLAGVVESAERAAERPCEPRVVLAQGVSKGEHMEYAIEKAVEVGAERVVPFLSKRSVVRLDTPEKRASKVERWQRVALASAKQSRRTFVPRVVAPVALRDLPDALADCDAVVVVWEDAERHADALGVHEALERAGLAGDARVAVVIGPEGGLAAEEVVALEAVGATTATLGPTVLRTETAAVVAVAFAMHALGGMGAGGHGG